MRLDTFEAAHLIVLKQGSHFKQIVKKITDAVKHSVAESLAGKYSSWSIEIYM